MPPKRRLNLYLDWLADLGFRGPSEEWDIEYMVWGVCGCPSGAGRRDDGDRYDTLGGGETVSRPELVDDLRTGGGVGTLLSVV